MARRSIVVEGTGLNVVDFPSSLGDPEGAHHAGAKFLHLSNGGTELSLGYTSCKDDDGEPSN